ncbi:MAG TPA: hypothetical protein PKH95_01695 [Candidatus Magasanikbacteria bacterium]|nr:hypothetical protein [Candidatus Magasanikbacteria bacterium]
MRSETAGFNPQEHKNHMTKTNNKKKWDLAEAKEAEEMKFRQKRINKEIEKESKIPFEERLKIAEREDLKSRSVLTEQNIKDLEEIHISNPFLYDEDEFEGEESKTKIISQEELEQKKLEQARKRIGRA